VVDLAAVKMAALAVVVEQIMAMAFLAVAVEVVATGVQMMAELAQAELMAVVEAVAVALTFLIRLVAQAELAP
jgi:hypothetical protein